MSLLTGWEPFRSLGREMARMRDEMDQLFDRWGFTAEAWPALAVRAIPRRRRERGTMRPSPIRGECVF
jgi:hypothetical protein